MAVAFCVMGAFCRHLKCRQAIYPSCPERKRRDLGGGNIPGLRTCRELPSSLRSLRGRRTARGRPFRRPAGELGEQPRCNGFGPGWGIGNFQKAWPEKVGGRLVPGSYLLDPRVEKLPLAANGLPPRIALEKAANFPHDIPSNRNRPRPRNIALATTGGKQAGDETRNQKRHVHPHSPLMSMVCPSLRLPSRWKVTRSTSLRMKVTAPSTMTAFTPPAWRLRGGTY